MKTLLQLWRMTWKERFLLLYSLWLLTCTGLALCLLPFYRVRQFVDRSRVCLRRKGSPNGPGTLQVARAISLAARLVPHATCLAVALCCHSMLRHYGYPSRVHVGISFDRKSHLLCHAWVESRGKIIVGEDDKLYLYREVWPNPDTSHII